MTTSSVALRGSTSGGVLAEAADGKRGISEYAPPQLRPYLLEWDESGTKAVNISAAGY